MCGFAGVLDLSASTPADRLIATARGMAATLAHRGPDAEGEWVSPEGGVAFSHRRLAVIDLTASGRQPMSSPSGRFVVVFNGEIYNFTSLREELLATGLKFRGHSDTEVLVAAFERWGVEPALKRMDGMFAIAVWDAHDRRLHLIRDRMGEKPLYFARVDGQVVFGSELKALRAHPAFDAAIDRESLRVYMTRGYVPAPRTIYSNARKVEPASIVTFGIGDRRRDPSITRYWVLADVARTGLTSADGNDAVEELHSTLRDAVASRMIADVPLGAFLSGGLDSSTVVALMQATSTEPVRTFTIGFAEAEHDEARHAAAVAQHLGTAHTEVRLTPRECRAVIPELPTVYDEPFADASQIPTLLVSRLARSQVTVALSGDGGDELFGGYSRYFVTQRLASLLRVVPRFVRGPIGRRLVARSPEQWDRVLSGAVVPGALGHRLTGHRVHKIGNALSSGDSMELYRRLFSYWDERERVVLGASEVALDDGEPALGPVPLLRQMMYADATTYLPDDILVKLDRASMAVSLEARVPLLAPSVVALSWRLPLSTSLHAGSGKGLLREVLVRYVPKALIDRPKMGFSVPLDSWLRGPLKQWAEDLLDPVQLRRDGLLDPEPIAQRWREHADGEHSWQYRLWTALMFQAWLERWR